MGDSYKWKMIMEEYPGQNVSFEMHDDRRVKEKETVKRLRKVLLYWSKVDAEMAAKKREEKLERAKKVRKTMPTGLSMEKRGISKKKPS